MTLWVLGSIALLLFVALILWMATKVERERAGKEQKPGTRVNSFFSGPVGTGIYKPIDDRRTPLEGADEHEPSQKEAPS